LPDAWHLEEEIPERKVFVIPAPRASGTRKGHRNTGINHIQVYRNPVSGNPTHPADQAPVKIKKYSEHSRINLKKRVK